jgi:hypothetical protein
MPALGCQRAPAAAAGAFDEVFDRETPVDHQVQVFDEHRRVERVPLDLAAQEKGTGAAQGWIRPAAG